MAGQTGRGPGAARTPQGCASTRVKFKPAANAAASEDVSNLSHSPHPGPPPPFPTLRVPGCLAERSGTSPDPLLSRKVPLGGLCCWGSSPEAPAGCQGSVSNGREPRGKTGSAWLLRRRLQALPEACSNGRRHGVGWAKPPDATQSLKMPTPRNAGLPWHPLNANSPLPCSSREKGTWRCPLLETALSLVAVHPAAAAAVVTAMPVYGCHFLIWARKKCSHVRVSVLCSEQCDF